MLCIVGVLCIPLMSHSNCTVPLIGSLGGTVVVCVVCIYMCVCLHHACIYGIGYCSLCMAMYDRFLLDLMMSAVS